MKVGTTPVLTEAQRSKVLESCFLKPSTLKAKKIEAINAASEFFGIKTKVRHKGKYDEEIVLMTNWENIDTVLDWVYNNYKFSLGSFNGKINVHPNY
jgi:hypothetical protein